LPVEMQAASIKSSIPGLMLFRPQFPFM